jgi:hypothetical protein
MTLALLAVLGLLVTVPGDAAVKARTILVVPFDASAVGADEQWIGEGAAQVVSLGFAQHPAFVQVERARLRPFGRPESWGESVVLQTARAMKIDAAAYGRVVRANNELVLQPKVVDFKAGGEPIALEPVTVAEGELLQRLASLPASYARTLRCRSPTRRRGGWTRPRRPRAR